jgi:hypothetical protein
MMTFVAALGGASLDCYVLMPRLQNRRGSRRSSSDSAGSDGTYAGEDGWSLASWFGGDHSGSDRSSNPLDCGGGDIAGGDSGGGGGGGDGAGGGE